MTETPTRFSMELFERPLPPAARRSMRFGVILLACLLFHLLVVVALVVAGDPGDTGALAPQEVEAEVVTEPPPPPKPEEPPPQEEPEKQKEAEKKPPPPPQTAKLDEKPAFDAPREQSKEKNEREAPDKETKAPVQAKPLLDRIAPQKAPETKATPSEQASKEDAPAPTPPDERPDAETIENAAPKPQITPEKKQPKPEKKAPPGIGAKSIAEQIAAMEPVQNALFGGASKPSPVAGGNAETSYLTILYGLIIPQFHPPSAPAKSRSNKGMISFYIDPRGNLIHQAVRRSSGSPQIDAAALAALRHAAPFPAPPTETPVGVTWEF